MSRSTRTCNRNGWKGLVQGPFQGDEALAKQWVADLGRASFFVDTRPLFAGQILAKWRKYFPHLITDTDKGPYPRIGGIAWR